MTLTAVPHCEMWVASGSALHHLLGGLIDPLCQRALLGFDTTIDRWVLETESSDKAGTITQSVSEHTPHELLSSGLSDPAEQFLLALNPGFTAGVWEGSLWSDLDTHGLWYFRFYWHTIRRAGHVLQIQPLWTSDRVPAWVPAGVPDNGMLRSPAA